MKIFLSQTCFLVFFQLFFQSLISRIAWKASSRTVQMQHHQTGWLCVWKWERERERDEHDSKEFFIIGFICPKEWTQIRNLQLLFSKQQRLANLYAFPSSSYSVCAKNRKSIRTVKSKTRFKFRRHQWNTTCWAHKQWRNSISILNSTAACMLPHLADVACHHPLPIIISSSTLTSHHPSVWSTFIPQRRV